MSTNNFDTIDDLPRDIGDAVRAIDPRTNPEEFDVALAEAVGRRIVGIAKVYALERFFDRYGRTPVPMSSDALIYNTVLTNLCEVGSNAWTASAGSPGRMAVVESAIRRVARSRMTI